MEQNLPIVAKKFWKTVRVLYFMLRKGISKGKWFGDISMMMKRGKLAGKAAIHNIILHHAVSSAHRRPPIYEYEFSCSNSPAAFFPPFRKHSRAAPAVDAELVAAALEMIQSAAASPALPGFGPSPMVRQLRITDSPFPLRDHVLEEDSHVDEAAERFIMKFYNDLKRQNDVARVGCS